MKRLIIIILFLFTYINLFSQVSENKYRLSITDKDNNEYSIEKPEEFLSAKSLNRRIKQGISIQTNDLPVSKLYLDSLENLGLTIINKSKWLNTVVVYTTNTQLIDTIDRYSFIKSKQKLTSSVSSNSYKNLLEQNIQSFAAKSDNYLDYGYATTQISMINGHVLHRNGYLGQGVAIAVIDAGFYNVDLLPAFDSLWNNNQILGTRDFVDNDTQVFDASNHGMKVLSTMGANMPGQLIGTAPKANYWLLRSEQVLTEFSVEEDNWAAAAEFADSVGVDIINSSLGYTEFDDINQNYTYADMDGNTTFITKAADLAASKGILVVNSAGNLGNNPWKYISAPGDGDSVLTVGAVDSYASLAYFSGLGPTSDGRIKPNVCAMGYQTAIQDTAGNITVASGTSFSSPIIAGMAACLWQFYPELNNMDILRKIEESAHQYSSPDNKLGYGIPDFGKAANFGNTDIISIINNEALIKTYPNPFVNNIHIEFLLKLNGIIVIELYNTIGEKLKVEKINAQDYNMVIEFQNLNNLPTGIYFLKIKIGNQYITKTLSKIN